MRAYGPLFFHPQLRVLLSASFPADLSDWFDYVAVIAILVYAWGEGPWALALLAMAMSLPPLLVGPLLAALVDRSDLRRALVLTNVGRALATFALILAPNLVALLAVVALRAAIDSAFTPARQAALQAITPPPLLGAASGALFSINQATKVAGPALGGLMLAAFPAQVIFALNGALSLVAALLLARLAITERPQIEAGSIFAAAPQGFVEFLRNRSLLGVLAFIVVGWGSVFIYDTLIAVLARQFGLGETIFGLSIAAAGIGGVIGALAAGAAPIRRPLPWMALGALISGPLAIGLGLVAHWGMALPGPVFLLVFLVAGFATGFILVPYRLTIQREAPPDRIARVFAAAEAITLLVVLFAPFVGSLIADRFGVGTAFMVGGGGLALTGLVAAGLSWRRVGI